MQYHINAAGVAVARDGAGVWRRFNTQTGTLSSFAAAPAPGTPVRTWTPPAPPQNPGPAPQAPNPGLAPNPAPNPVPRQPMSPAQRSWLAFGFFGLAAVIAIILIAKNDFGGTRQQVAVTPPPATQQPAQVQSRPTPGPRLFCRGNDFLYRDARYGGAPKCWPGDKRDLLPPEWVLR